MVLLKENVGLLAEESRRIIGACFEVHKILGPGFLEQVYHEALKIEFEERSIPFESEAKLEINYKHHVLVKHYSADFICFDSIVLEIKAINSIASEHIAQVLNYLKASDLPLGLLINFGTTSVQVKRLINKYHLKEPKFPASV